MPYIPKHLKEYSRCIELTQFWTPSCFSRSAQALLAPFSMLLQILPKVCGARHQSISSTFSLRGRTHCKCNWYKMCLCVRTGQFTVNLFVWISIIFVSVFRRSTYVRDSPIPENPNHTSPCPPIAFQCHVRQHRATSIPTGCSCKHKLIYYKYL